MVASETTLSDLSELLGREADGNGKERTRPEVLVIDDDAGIRAALELYLSGLYDVTTCASGDEGVKRLSPHAHAVVLDIKMRGKDGFVTFTNLKRPSQEVPIIFYSAYQNIKNPLEILNEYRPFGYVIKDGNPQALAHTVSSAVAHYRQILNNRKLVSELQELNATLEQRVHDRTLELEQRTRELEEALRQLKHLTETDPLTAIANRRHFFSTYDHLLQETSQPVDKVSLVIADIDHFKRLNDRYGHPVGDLALRTVASLLKSHVREGDLVARIGGEEFAVLLPDTGLADALVCAERLRAVVAQHEIRLEDGRRPIKLTISLGCCSAEGVSPNPDTLYTIADRALYLAKERGRNNLAHLPYEPLIDGCPPSVR